MRSTLWISTSLSIGASALIAMSSGFAHDMDEHMHMHAGHGQKASASMHPSGPETVSVKPSNTLLSDSEGRQMRLEDDVIGDRIIVLSFVYTSCTTVCPMVTSVMSDLQSKLGSRLDKDVRLVTLTVDPARDTPSKLKSYAAQFDAKPSWFWLTGSSVNVTQALKSFGAYTPNFENHPVIVMIGDGQTGKWSRHYGLSKSDQFLSQVDEYLSARQ